MLQERRRLEARTSAARCGHSARPPDDYLYDTWGNCRCASAADRSAEPRDKFPGGSDAASAKWGDAGSIDMNYQEFLTLPGLYIVDDVRSAFVLGSNR